MPRHGLGMTVTSFSAASLIAVLAAVGEAQRLPDPVLAEPQSAPDAAVELGLHQMAQHVRPRPQRERQLEWHRRRWSSVLGAAPQTRAAAVKRNLPAPHRHRHHPPALPRLVELLHLFKFRQYQCTTVHN